MFRLSRGAIKGQAIADLLAENPVLDQSSITEELPDEEVFVAESARSWTFYLDGSVTGKSRNENSSAVKAAGIELVFVSQKKMCNSVILSFKLTFPCTNNVAEYEAWVWN